MNHTSNAHVFQVPQACLRRHSWAPHKAAAQQCIPLDILPWHQDNGGVICGDDEIFDGINMDTNVYKLCILCIYIYIIHYILNYNIYIDTLYM